MRCSNDIEEIYQGEELFVEGCVYDDDDETLDITNVRITAQVSSSKGVCCTFSTTEGTITKEPDQGVFSFTVPKTATQKMRGLYFVAVAIDINEESLISDQYKAFEVKQSNIRKSISK